MHHSTITWSPGLHCGVSNANCTSLAIFTPHLPFNIFAVQFVHKYFAKHWKTWKRSSKLLSATCSASWNKPCLHCETNNSHCSLQWPPCKRSGTSQATPRLPNYLCIVCQGWTQVTRTYTCLNMLKWAFLFTLLNSQPSFFECWKWSSFGFPRIDQHSTHLSGSGGVDHGISGGLKVLNRSPS